MAATQTSQTGLAKGSNPVTKKKGSETKGKTPFGNVGKLRRTKVVSTVKEQKAKRYGAINEHGILHNDVLKALSEFGREQKSIKEKLGEFTDDLLVYSSKYYPAWSLEDKKSHRRFLEDVRELLKVVEKYDWSTPEYPSLSTKDAWKLYNMYCGYFTYQTRKQQRAYEDFWDAVAEITGYHKIKDEGDYLDSENIAAAFKTRELITQLLWDFIECEDDGKSQARKELTQTKMNGNYMDDGSAHAIRNNELLKLVYIEHSDRLEVLSPGKLIAVASEKEKDDRLQSNFSIGWLTQQEIKYNSLSSFSIRYANGEISKFESSDVKAIYLVSK